MNRSNDAMDPGLVRARFRDPAALVAQRGLSREDKIRALLDWKQELLELQKAGEENMPDLVRDTDIASRMQAVNDALIALGPRSRQSY